MTSASAVRRAALGLARRAAVVLALAAGSAALAPARGAAQTIDRAVRFPVTTVGDSTFTFDVGALRWVKAGDRGMAVDPRRRDALVARFQILRVDGGVATALVTGETTQLSPEHVAVLEMPARPWYASSLFWAGALLGLVGGAAIGSH